MPVGGFPAGVLQWRGEEHPKQSYRCSRDVTAIFSLSSSHQPSPLSSRSLGDCCQPFVCLFIIFPAISQNSEQLFILDPGDSPDGPQLQTSQTSADPEQQHQPWSHGRQNWTTEPWLPPGFFCPWRC